MQDFTIAEREKIRSTHFRTHNSSHLIYKIETSLIIFIASNDTISIELQYQFPKRIHINTHTTFEVTEDTYITDSLIVIRNQNQ